VHVADREYECGASILHSSNKYMSDFADTFGMHRRDRPDHVAGLKKLSSKDDGERMGLYDGREFVYEDSRWPFVSTVKLLWRYGYDLWRLKTHISDMLRDFSRSVHIHRINTHPSTESTHSKITVNPMTLSMKC
jgi:prenylcysteine oxidase/farnesylcysteine lyase